MPEFLIFVAVIACIYFVAIALRRLRNQGERDLDLVDDWGKSSATPRQQRRRFSDDIPRPTAPLPPIPASLTLTGRAYIIDGDTIRVQGVKVRLAGIDAPELNMPWGQSAKWALIGICKGQTITAKLDGERSFDRLIGTCYLPDGRDIGAEIVKLGLALDLPFHSGVKYRCFEPEGARRKLCNGKFGHRSISAKDSAPETTHIRF